MAKLAYQVAYFGDSDRDLNPSAEQMKAEGVEEVLIWDGSVEIERRLCLDLPLKALGELIDLAGKLSGNEQLAEQKQAVWDKIYEQLPKDSYTRNQDFEALKSEIKESNLREHIGIAADNGKWFKRRDKGEELGQLLARYLDQMQTTSTMTTLRALEAWCYG